LLLISQGSVSLAAMDSTRDSAALAGSQPSPNVTRLFIDRIQKGMRSASASTRELLNRSLSFRAVHEYMSPMLKATPPRRDDANSRTEPTAAPRTEAAAAGQLASVSDLVDERDRPSGLASDGSSRGFVTAPPMHPATQPMTPAVHTPGAQRVGVDHVRERSLALPESDDFSDLEDFTEALLTMRKSGARISARDTHGDDVQRNLFANTGVAVNQLVLSRDCDSSTSVLRDDVSHISISPVFSVVAVNQLALSGATPYSDYRQLERAASALKSARGHEIQGAATPPVWRKDRANPGGTHAREENSRCVVNNLLLAFVKTLKKKIV
jgi:hypothetical protein